MSAEKNFIGADAIFSYDVEVHSPPVAGRRPEKVPPIPAEKPDYYGANDNVAVEEDGRMMRHFHAM